MGQRTKRGRVYRRCGCQDEHKKQLGPWCMRLLADAKHGTWTYAVDLAREDDRRRVRRRGGFASRAEAARAMAAVREAGAGWQIGAELVFEFFASAGAARQLLDTGFTRQG
ncbi:hypothetical protein P3T27_006275 [Kitasatospora sp. MAA19]|uniref:hypothetical protein n=1 Tax=Kitasatospora sp. MAA19 TaxID=3035090 RepID=UPI00247570CE|nr:hypothetical protein [Kitasatospora sp. MAA19]MDH6709527.1 hypothetical protein [Kitasatospora sp. MAA19]